MFGWFRRLIGKSEPLPQQRCPECGSTNVTNEYVVAVGAWRSTCSRGHDW